MIRTSAWLLSAVCVAWALPSSALAMRCGTHLVERGDTRLELLARCGEPTDVARAVEEHTSIVRGDDVAVGRTVRVVVDTYLYNFGPTQLMRRVELRNGVISAISTAGQGFEPSAAPHTDRPVHLGDARAQVRRAWGDPADHEAHTTTRGAAEGDRDGVELARTTVEVETWTYNFGATRFMRRVTFENGRVVRVETLGIGF